MRRLVLLALVVPTFAFADVLSEAPKPKPIRVPAAPAKTAPRPAPKKSRITLAMPSGASALAPDAGDCRMACAAARYACEADTQGEDCGGGWSRCVASCGLPAIDPGASAAPP